jgi:hypothetical protein
LRLAGARARFEVKEDDPGTGHVQIRLRAFVGELMISVQLSKRIGSRYVNCPGAAPGFERR